MLWSTQSRRGKPRVRYCPCAATNSQPDAKARKGTPAPAIPVPGSPEDPCSDYAYGMAAIARVLRRYPEVEKVVHQALLEADKQWRESREGLRT